MASNKIQIKRSTANAVVTGLSNGELAFTQASNTLYIGLPDGSGVLRIAGAQIPGILTANQALVANATSGIDKVIVANLVPTQIYANGSIGTAGDVLTTNGSVVYWRTPSAGVAGSDTQVQFNDAGSLSGDPGLTYNKTTDSLTSNNFYAVSVVNAATLSVGTSTVANSTGVYSGVVNGSVLSVGTSFIANSIGTYHTGTANALSFTVGTATVANATGVYTGVVNATTVSVGTATISNGTGVFTTGTVNAATLSVGTSVVANTTRLVIGTGVGVSANGGIGSDGQVLTSNATTVYWSTPTTGTVTSVSSGNGLSGGPITSSGTLSVLANNGIVSNSTGVFVNANNGIVANSSGVFAKSANGISVDSSGINVVGGDGLVSNATGVHVGAANGITVSSDAIAVNGGSTLTVNTSGVHVNSSLSITNLTLAGNLTINGTLTTVDTTNLTVKDSMIELANGNISTDSLDIGLYGQFGVTGTTKYTGFFRDASDGIYKMFTDLETEPTTTVATGDATYKLATLQSYLASGGLVSNATNVTITANSTLAVSVTANTLTLATALAGTSGGTGKTSVTNNAILVGNSTNGYNELTLGTSGYVLQSNGTALVYDVLDGGLF